MAKVNDNYLKLPGSYLFSTIGKKVREYAAANPDAKILYMGIGDVTQPIAPEVISALHKSVDEMAHAETFKGYAPDLGYEFLRDVIARKDYKDMRSLCRTAQSATAATSRRSSVSTTGSRSVIRSIRCMWIPT